VLLASLLNPETVQLRNDSQLKALGAVELSIGSKNSFSASLNITGRHLYLGHLQTLGASSHFKFGIVLPVNRSREDTFQPRLCQLVAT